VVTAVPSAGSAQEAIRSIHGDWQIRCETPAGSPAEQCALFQSVVAEDHPNVGITVMVFKSATPQTRLLRVRVPLGVYLSKGLWLKIDDAYVGGAGFDRCLQTGCFVEVQPVDDALLGRMRNGQTATFFVFQNAEEGVGFPISLKGFGEGYDKLP
jgi:invasion protein IalB